MDLVSTTPVPPCPPVQEYLHRAPAHGARHPQISVLWLAWKFTSIGNSLIDRKSTRLNSSHQIISYAVFRLKKKNKKQIIRKFDGQATKNQCSYNITRNKIVLLSKRIRTKSPPNYVVAQIHTLLVIVASITTLNSSFIKMTAATLLL